MKTKVLVLLSVVFLACCASTDYVQEEDLLTKMQKMVPIFEKATVIEKYMPAEKMGVISLEVDVADASQKEVLDFYKDTMTQKGWELKKFKDYGKNGSIMELVNKDMGTLSVMTIMKKTKKTGKIPVTLNLTVE